MVAGEKLYIAIGIISLQWWQRWDIWINTLWIIINYVCSLFFFSIFIIRCIYQLYKHCLNSIIDKQDYTIFPCMPWWLSEQEVLWTLFFLLREERGSYLAPFITGGSIWWRAWKNLPFLQVKIKAKWICIWSLDIVLGKVCLADKNRLLLWFSNMKIEFENTTAPQGFSS